MAEPSATPTTPTTEPAAPAAEPTSTPAPAAPEPATAPVPEPTPEPELTTPDPAPAPDASLAKLATTASEPDEPTEPDADDAKLPAGLISDKAYDILKWVAIIVLPAIATFVIGLGGIWSWPIAGSVAATITAIGVLLGAVLGLSAVKYSASK